MKKNNGITITSLVIVIIIVLILTGTSIAFLGGETGAIKDSKKAKTKNELHTYKEQFEYFIACRELEDTDFKTKTLNAGINSLYYNTQEKSQEGQGSIIDVIPIISDEFIDKIEIIKGKIVLNTKDVDLIEMAQEVGITPNPYDIEDGVLLSSTSNLLLVDENGTLTIPDSVTKIGEGAFANLEGLKTIIIPGTCKEIASNAFSYNKTLEKVIMEDGVLKIGTSAFGFCSNLKEVQMPNSVTTMNGQAFYNCSKLESINLSSSLTTISSNAFSSCVSLKEVIIPEGVKTLQGSCFANMTITEIDIPSSVTSIATGTFTNCKNLTNINLENNKYYFFNDGVLSNKAGTSIIFMTNSKLTSSDVFSIPEGITSFTYALQSYTNIKKLIIPSTLTKLTLSQGSYLPPSIEEIEVANGNTTFVSEDNLLYTKNDNKLICCFSKETNIVIKEGIESFGSIVFKTAPNAQVITLPESATTLGYMIFTNGPSKLQNVIIGKSVTKIDPMFKYSHRVGTVTISEENPNYVIENNVIYTKDKKQIVTVVTAISGEFTIPSGIEKIQTQAFHAQSEMKSIVIPNTVTEIGTSFGYCSGLTSITIPSSVTKIGSSCFANCGNLSEIIINKAENSISGAPWGATKGAKVVKWKT